MSRRTDTSAAAYMGILSSMARLERVVLETLHSHPTGLTVDETCAAAGYPRYSLQPRFTALKERQAIIDTGLRRQNVSGAKAIVWRIMPRSGGEA
ncbi:hypothetical protein [Sphingomonas sp. S-NIH.Pt15_0812]|uniref:hypothetical protein n=1 Tax=Sphingomonas sp. S-NIH.Pt15_0812 TaxID=1920129 RepID=UPI000F7E7C70|nr:hypothetical protein [Sphingomonas sp. S-NIH.Pt15_0812]RSU54391.1 hypothetical protein BRX43_02440 [Sphingomonas sp. S-NIH.Pt15_0812]